LHLKFVNVQILILSKLRTLPTPNFPMKVATLEKMMIIVV